MLSGFAVAIKIDMNTCVLCHHDFIKTKKKRYFPTEVFFKEVFHSIKFLERERGREKNERKSSITNVILSACHFCNDLRIQKKNKLLMDLSWAKREEK